MQIMATMGRRDIRAVSLVGAGHFMSHFYQLTLPPLFVYIKPDLDISFAALGFVMMVYFTATAMVQVPIGMMVDRFGARPVLILGMALQAAAIAGAGLASNYPALLGLSFLAGIGNAVFHPADFAILSAAVEEKWLGRAYAVHSLGGSVGFVAAPLTLVTLAQLYDWRLAFMVVGLVGLAVAFLMVLAGDIISDRGPGAVPVRKAAKDDGGSGGSRWRFMASRPMVLFFLFYVMTSASGVGMTNCSVVALIDVYGASLPLANTVLTVFLAAAIVGVLPGGFLADFTRHHNLVLVVCFLVLAAAVGALGTGWLPWWAIFAAVIVAGLMRGVYNSSRDVLVRRAAPDGSIGTAFGFVTLGYTVGQGVTPVVYGWLMDMGSASMVFYVAAAFALLSIATVLASRDGAP